jgi:hypothetical protein
MQLAGTHAGVRRADRVGAPDLSELRGRHPHWRVASAMPAEAPGGADARCSAQCRFAASVPGGGVRRSAANPGTRHGPCPPSAPRTRWRWAPGPGSAPPRRPPSGRCHRMRGRTWCHGRGARTGSSSLLAQHQQQVAGLLGDPGAVGVGGDPSQVDAPGGSSMREQHVQPSQPYGVDGEEVAGEEPGGLLAQERPPRGRCPPRGRVEAMTTQRGADRSRRGLYAEVEQLALDLLVAPAGILGRQADDQLL